MSATLEQDLATRIPEIRDAFVSVLEAYCGPDAGIPEICASLGLHRKLAWQVRGVAFGDDLARTVRMMPSRAGIDALIDAIADRPGGAELGERVRTAAASFEQMVRMHARDRSWLEMLTEAATGDDQAEERWREQAYRGNSFIWGAHARALVLVMILHPSSARPGWLDLAIVRGLVGLTRVRPQVRWLVTQSIIKDDDENVGDPRRRPIDEAGAEAAGGVPLLPEFCSTPAPSLRRVPGPGGMLHDELLEAPVGHSGQQTIYTGEVIHELAPAHATHENKRAYFGSGVRTPARVLIYDHFVHRDLFPGVERELCVYGELNSPTTTDDNDRLAMSERIVPLGSGLARAHCPELPGHADVLRSLFSRLGWDPEPFDHHRVRMAFPPMPASVMIRHDLPRPASGEGE